MKSRNFKVPFGFNMRWKQFSLFSTFLYECGGQRYNSTLVDKVEECIYHGSNVDRRVLTGRWQNPEIVLTDVCKQRE